MRLLFDVLSDPYGQHVQPEDDLIPDIRGGPEHHADADVLRDVLPLGELLPLARVERGAVVFDTQAEMCTALQKGLSTVKKALADLEHFDLLTRERGGFEKLCSYQLLILDDFGMERDTSFALETVYDVIDGRYLSGKPLIVTTNLTLDELKKPQDVDHQRIYDRVLAMTVPIRFTGDSLRSGQRSTKREIVKDIFEGGDC